MKFEKTLVTWCPCCGDRYFRPQTTGIKNIDLLRIPVRDDKGNHVDLELKKCLTVRCKDCEGVVWEGQEFDDDYKEWIKGNARKECPHCKKRILEKIGT